MEVVSRATMPLVDEYEPPLTVTVTKARYSLFVSEAFNDEDGRNKQVRLVVQGQARFSSPYERHEIQLEIDQIPDMDGREDLGRIYADKKSATVVVSPDTMRAIVAAYQIGPSALHLTGVPKEHRYMSITEVLVRSDP